MSLRSLHGCTFPILLCFLCRTLYWTLPQNICTYTHRRVHSHHRTERQDTWGKNWSLFISSSKYSFNLLSTLFSHVSTCTSLSLITPNMLQTLLSLISLFHRSIYSHSDHQLALGRLTAKSVAAGMRISTTKSKAVDLSWNGWRAQYGLGEICIPQGRSSSFSGSCS